MSYEHTYADGEDTVTLSFEDKAQKTGENDIELLSKSIKLIQKDGIVSFSSHGKVERYDSSEAEASFSYRYDRTGNVHTVSCKNTDAASGEKLNVKVTLSYGDGKLDCTLNKDGGEYARLLFDTKDEGAYRVHTLSSVNVNGRDEDATGTGMKITVDLT